VAVARSARHQTVPAVGPGAIAWTELASMDDELGDVFAMKLDPWGVPIGTPRLLGKAWRGVALAIALDDFVIWHSPDGIVGKRVNDDAGPVVLGASQDRWAMYPVVASSDAGFLLVWDGGHVQAFTQRGQAVGPHHDLYAAELPLWNGSEYLVFGNAWYGVRDAVRAHRFNPSGVPIGDWIEFDLSTAVSAVWTGSEYRVAHVSERTHTLWITRFTPSLERIASTPAVIEGYRYENALLTRDLLIYLAPHRGTVFGDRLVARRIAEDVTPPRRRRVGSD
jgi:hypothetical protein